MSERQKDGPLEPDRDKQADGGSEADAVSADDRHKTEKLARHDGVDPNEGQE
jgi:hypothetical protein